MFPSRHFQSTITSAYYVELKSLWSTVSKSTFPIDHHKDARSAERLEVFGVSKSTFPIDHHKSPPSIALATCC